MTFAPVASASFSRKRAFAFLCEDEHPEPGSGRAEGEGLPEEPGLADAPLSAPCEPFVPSEEDKVQAFSKRRRAKTGCIGRGEGGE